MAGDLDMYERIKRIFNSPSRRRDGDYSKPISLNARNGVRFVFRDHLDPDVGGICQDLQLRKTIRDLGHLYHSFAHAAGAEDFATIVEFLRQEQSTGAFLDFLEISLRHIHPNNEFVRTINRVLEEHDSPYSLTQYSTREVPIKGWRRPGDPPPTAIEVTSYPRAYLRHETEVQKRAIEPALEVLSDPAYKTPDEDFRTALKREREGDYDGCVTACSSAVEGAIKVAAAKLKWPKVRGNGLEAVAHSFISRTSLPNSATLLFRPLSSWRNTQSDAHGHVTKDETTEELARHFIAESASLIALVQSQFK